MADNISMSLPIIRPTTNIPLPISLWGKRQREVLLLLHRDELAMPTLPTFPQRKRQLTHELAIPTLPASPQRKRQGPYELAMSEAGPTDKVPLPILPPYQLRIYYKVAIEETDRITTFFACYFEQFRAIFESHFPNGCHSIQAFIQNFANTVVKAFQVSKDLDPRSTNKVKMQVIIEDKVRLRWRLKSTQAMVHLLKARGLYDNGVGLSLCKLIKMNQHLSSELTGTRDTPNNSFSEICRWMRTETPWPHRCPNCS